MPQGAVPRRYAEAAIALAKKKNNIERWRTDLRTAAEVLSAPRVMAALEDPGIPNESKKRLITQGLTVTPDPLVMNMLDLVDSGRIGLLPRIAAEFVEMANKELGIVVAEITTAIPIDNKTQKELESRIKQMTGAKQIEIRNKVDPRIIAGMVARIGDELYDGSVRTRLADLAERLS